MLNQFKRRLKAQTVGRKLLLLATFLTMVATFLPWYSDMDRFNIGDTFLGITGPLYLAGFIVLAASGLTFTIVMMQLSGKKQYELPIKEGHLHVFNAILAVVMLLLVNSVYFHPKFGISIADKTPGFGMVIALAGVGLFLFSAIASRNTDVALIVEQTEGIERKLFNMVESDRERGEMTREKTVEEAIAEHKKELENTKDIYGR